MSDSYEIARFLDHLRQRGFDVTRLSTRGDHLVRRQEGGPASVQRLLLNSTLFDEYFDAAYANWDLAPGSIDRGEEILSLMVTEAEVALMDAVGLGLRRGTSGSVEWYRFEEPPELPDRVPTSR